MWLCRKRNFAVKETVITMHYGCIIKLSYLLMKKIYLLTTLNILEYSYIFYVRFRYSVGTFRKLSCITDNTKLEQSANYALINK